MTRMPDHLFFVRSVIVGITVVFFCMQRGEWLGRVIMPLTNSELRTNESFRNRVQRKHHSKDRRRSILENIPYLDMVLDFPNDPVHLVPLGTVKKTCFPLAFW